MKANFICFAEERKKSSSGAFSPQSALEEDEVEGNEDEDTIHGQAGDDTIFGNDGDDLILSQTDDDIVSGGAGEDAFASLLTREWAGRLSAEGGIGLADHIYRALAAQASPHD